MLAQCKRLRHLVLLTKSGRKQPLRTLTSSGRTAAPAKGQIIGEFKGFKAPSWSVEEKLLKQRQENSRVGPADIRRLANLSYLNVPDDKLDSLAKDMDKILQSVATMETVDTNGVEPLLSILEDFSLKTRPDIARATTSNSEDGPIATQQANTASDTNVEWGYVETPDPKILENASQKELGYFVVPKQKQPWEEDAADVEDEDVLPLREVQRNQGSR